jgi:hypothetical protein
VCRNTVVAAWVSSMVGLGSMNERGTAGTCVRAVAFFS